MRQCARPWPRIPLPVRTSRQWSGTYARRPRRRRGRRAGGTGKTFVLGIARHAWQLDGYRLLAAAPTGIATLSLQDDGFENVATCDRLLLDLDKGQEQLDARTILVVDEAGMLGSRKLTRLLEHAQHGRAKAVLVGDDRQLAAIDAGGGMRPPPPPRASELTENRRQHQAWEREALDLVRSGLVEEAVAAYQDAEVDRLNTACQELLAARGRLGVERLRSGSSSWDGVARWASTRPAPARTASSGGTTAARSGPGAHALHAPAAHLRRDT